MTVIFLCCVVVLCLNISNVQIGINALLHAQIKCKIFALVNFQNFIMSTQKKHKWNKCVIFVNFYLIVDIIIGVVNNYTNPKLLHCFHVFCEKCLKPVAQQTPQGQVKSGVVIIIIVLSTLFFYVGRLQNNAQMCYRGYFSI